MPTSGAVVVGFAVVATFVVVAAPGEVVVPPGGCAKTNEKESVNVTNRT
jgi:hypothetical protein